MQWPWGRSGKVQARQSSPWYRPARLQVEELEARLALSPLTPVQTRRAYGFDQVSFTVNGQTIRGDGAGQTIAIVVAYGHASIFQDVDTFSRSFTLGGSRTLLQEYGAASTFLTIATPQGTPQVDPGGLWALEAALDVQWAHAIAPAADILLVQARTNSFADLMGAVEHARQQPGVSVVSLSWGAANSRTRRPTTPPSRLRRATWAARTAAADRSWRAASPSWRPPATAARPACGPPFPRTWSRSAARR